MPLQNQARGYAYLYEMLKQRQEDPYCRTCSAYNNTITAVRESLAKFENQLTAAEDMLSAEFARLYSEARAGIASLKLAENPAGQKKAGNCKLPEGVCFVKLSYAIFQKL
ncbi:MAG TPA: hypothetical protein VL122_12635 [Nitrospirota bacterium]|nr:hypothetical protein [Nitrospirota bacterium]